MRRTLRCGSSPKAAELLRWCATKASTSRDTAEDGGVRGLGVAVRRRGASARGGAHPAAACGLVGVACTRLLARAHGRWPPPPQHLVENQHRTRCIRAKHLTWPARSHWAPWWSLQPWERSVMHVLPSLTPATTATRSSTRVTTAKMWSRSLMFSATTLGSGPGPQLGQLVVTAGHPPGTIGHDRALAKQSAGTSWTCSAKYKKLGDRCLALWVSLRWVDGAVLNANSRCSGASCAPLQCANPLVGPYLGRARSHALDRPPLKKCTDKWWSILSLTRPR